MAAWLFSFWFPCAACRNFPSKHYGGGLARLLVTWYTAIVWLSFFTKILCMPFLFLVLFWEESSLATEGLGPCGSHETGTLV